MYVFFKVRDPIQHFKTNNDVYILAHAKVLSQTRVVIYQLKEMFDLNINKTIKLQSKWIFNIMLYKNENENKVHSFEFRYCKASSLEGVKFTSGELFCDLQALWSAGTTLDALVKE